MATAVGRVLARGAGRSSGWIGQASGLTGGRSPSLCSSPRLTCSASVFSSGLQNRPQTSGVYARGFTSDARDPRQQQKQQPQEPDGVVQPISHSSKSSSQKPASKESNIVEVTPVNIELVFSSRTPVILDFYANWCEPCKQLEPYLIDFVNKFSGKVKLAKINIDKLKDVAQQFNIQQIPAMFFLHEGQVKFSFLGTTADDFNRFLGDMAGVLAIGALEEKIAEASKHLDEGDVASAVSIYQSLTTSKNNAIIASGIAGLARCALADNDVDTAKQLVTTLKEGYAEQLQQSDVQQAITFVELQSQGSSEELPKLLEAVQTNPKDQQARYDLALFYFSKTQYSKALEELFTMLKQDKTWNEEAARKLLIKIFEALGPTNKLTESGRKRFSNIWFS